MSYLPYIVAAYTVFALVLAWDWLAARRQLRNALRQAQAHRGRPLRTQAAPSDTELAR